MLKSAKRCAVSLVLPLVCSQAAQAAYNLNFQEPATRVAREVYDLHTLIMVIIALIGLVVFAAMFYSIYAHRKSKGHQAAQFHENTTVEVVWTVIPFFILIGMAYPATKAVLMQKDTANPDITIKTTGYQWKWGYDYLKGEGEGIHFVSNLSTPREQIEGKAAKGEHYLLEVDNPMVVPVGKKVRVLVTANDVIHSWWVPNLGVKQDANPGFIRDTWFQAEKEGVYRGNCAELCGKEHGFMPIEVHVVSAERYTAWVTEQKKKLAAQADDPNKTYSMDELKQRGEKVYAANCAVCHQANGKGVPPAFPALDGSKVTLGPIAAHIDLVLNGKAGTAMAAFKQLNDVEIASVVTFERNAWGNKAGDITQPADIRTIRAGGKMEPKSAASPAAAPASAASRAGG